MAVPGGGGEVGAFAILGSHVVASTAEIYVVGADAAGSLPSGRAVEEFAFIHFLIGFVTWRHGALCAGE